MVEFIDSFLSKLRFLFVGTIMVGALLMLPFFLSAVWKTPTVQAASTRSTQTSTSPLDDNPNIIAQGMYSAANKVGKVTNSVGQAASNSLHSATKTIASTSTKSSKFVAHGVGSGANFIADGVTGSLSFIGHTTGSAFGFVGKTPGITEIIRPEDRTPIPVIESDKSDVSAAQVKSDTLNAVQPQNDSNASWPIHGEITLEFGVPHWPYQPTHTGIDISDDALSGVTPIRPFKPGRVIEAIHSDVGFGNHVIIDHGGGITSLYGHLASISIQVGQEVNKSTILGYEGSTGASTGTHLHFEIRLNGQPQDPHKYVSGRP